MTHNNNENNTQTSVSQKANALANYTEQYHAYTFEQYWTPLNTYRIVMPLDIEDDEDNPFLDTNEEYFEKKAKAAWHHLGGDRSVFIRVCPVEPRPGVLESTAAHSLEQCVEEMIRIGNDMFELEPNGCIIVQPFIHAHASAVMGPGKRVKEQAPKKLIALLESQDDSNSFLWRKKKISGEEMTEILLKSGWSTNDIGRGYRWKQIPGYVSISGGHDGVTAATGQFKIALPVRAPKWQRTIFESLNLDSDKHELEFVSMLKDDDGVRIDEKDMFDALHTSHTAPMNNFITQLRGCTAHTPPSAPPAGVSISGLVPQGEVIASEVYLVTGKMEDYAADLEARLAKGFDEGFVVSHPSGDFNSHAGSCARTAGAPYIISRVEEGDLWMEVAPRWVVANDPSFTPNPYDPLEYKRDFIEGISVGLYHWTRMYAHLGHHFHQYVNGPIHDPAGTAFLGGVYTGWLINAVMSVSLGEMRHSSNHRRANHPAVYATLNGIFDGDWVETSGKLDTCAPPNIRQHYYYTMEKTPLTMRSSILSLEWMSKMFGENWSGSYGGKKYQASVNSALSLLRTVDELVKDQTRENLNKCIVQANITKNAVHNTGFFFNKFVKKSTMDMAAKDAINPYLEQLFMIYYAAVGANERRGTLPELRDVSDILMYTLNNGPTTWRITPIYMDKTAPKELRDSIDTIIEQGRGLLHCGGGDTVQPTHKKFIPCGHPDCSYDKQHNNWLQEQEIESQQAILAEVFGSNHLSLLDIGASNDMWLAQPSFNEEEQEWLLETCSGIKAKEIQPDIDMLQKIFDTMNPSAPYFNTCSTIMGKFFAKIEPESLKEITKGLKGEEKVPNPAAKHNDKPYNKKKILVWDSLDETFKLMYHDIDVYCDTCKNTGGDEE